MGTDLSKAKGLKRVGELLSGSRVKKLDAAVTRTRGRLADMNTRNIRDTTRHGEYRIDATLGKIPRETGTRATERASKRWAGKAKDNEISKGQQLEKAKQRSSAALDHVRSRSQHLSSERDREDVKVLNARLAATSGVMGSAALGVSRATKNKQKASRQKKAFAEAVHTIAEGVKQAALGTIVSKAGNVGRVGGTMTTNALKSPGPGPTQLAVNPRRSIIQAMGAFRAR